MNVITDEMQLPKLRNGVVHRPRLLERLGTALPKLMLFSAPAGFGKTTLARDWLRQAQLPFAWVSLEAEDNEPQRFYVRLAAALRTLHPALEVELESLETAGTHVPDALFLRRLCDALRTFTGAGVLVLDDYQYIEAQPIHDAVRQLLSHLGAELHLLLLSRIDPPMPLGRLRVSGELLELREQELRFTREETSTFFDLALPNAIPERLVALLEERTEGWAAGLRMAALALQGAADPEAVVNAFSGNHHFVMDYLLEEALARQPEEVQRFLMQTSILSRFDAELCAAVTRDPQAPRLLEVVETANLFLVPLDAEHRWFRYHHLFAELLEYRLRRLHPEMLDLLHERASAWLDAAGEAQEALRHATRITAPARFLELLDRRGFELIARSELATFERWLRYVPDAESQPYPMLLLALAWFRLLTERAPELEPLLQAAESALAAPAVPYPPAREEEIRLLVAALRAYQLRFQGRPVEAIAASSEVLDRLSGRHRFVQGVLLFNQARAHMQLGEVRPAHGLLQRAFEANLATGTAYLVLASLGHVGAVLLQIEGVDRARDALESALELARDRHLDALPGCGVILYQLGRVHLVANEPERAREALEQAIELGRKGREPEVVANGLLQLARVHTVLGEFDAARSLLIKAEIIMHADNANPFDTTLQVERARVALLSGDVPAATELSAGFVGDPQHGEDQWTVHRESEIILLLQLALARGDVSRARPLAERLRREAQTRGRNLALCFAAVAEAVLHPPGAEGWEQLDDALATAARRGYLRPWLDGGAPVYALLRSAFQRPVSPAAAAFARLLLSSAGADAAVAAPAIPKFLQSVPSPLTEREQEVLYHLSRTASNKAIARAMHISLETVKSHRKHIYAKLGACDRAEALERAGKLGLHLEGARS